MSKKLFEKIAGPLKLVNTRLAVGRCPTCGESEALFIDLKTGSFRCGHLPRSFYEDTGQHEGNGEIHT